RVLGDIGESEVPRPERVQEDDRGDGSRAEGGVERVSPGIDQAPTAGIGAEAAADRRVDDERERQCKRGATEILPLSSALRRRVLRRALRRDRRRGEACAVVVADDVDVTACPEEVRLGPVKDDRYLDVLVRPVDVAETETKALRGMRVAG